jgi:hypothetical protein
VKLGFGLEPKAQIKTAVENPNTDLVVKSKTPVTKQKLNVIDLETNDLIDIDVNLADAWQTKPSLTRTRPTAYILMPTQENLVEKLKILGLQVQQLKNALEVEVENYMVTDYRKDAEKTEGVFRQNVSTNTKVVKRNFPQGSYVVYMNQPNSNLAVEVLEPEAPNSFVSLSVLETELNQELPIYRYLAKNNL